MKQFNVRLPETTIDRINKLSKIYGSQAKAVIAAVENLHTKEIEMSTKSKSIKFYVIRDLDAYGDGATDNDIDEYTQFATNWLKQHGYSNVDVEYYDGFLPTNLDDAEREAQEYLSSAIWDAWCAS